MKYQCLMIDDDVTIAETTAEYFNIFDISTAYVTSFDEAVKFIDENQVSLLLLDINLGEKSGFELCKKITGNIRYSVSQRDKSRFSSVLSQYASS